MVLLYEVSGIDFLYRRITAFVIGVWSFFLFRR